MEPELKRSIDQMSRLTDAVTALVLIALVFVATALLPVSGLGPRFVAFLSLVGGILGASFAEGWLHKTHVLLTAWDWCRLIVALGLWVGVFLPIAAMQQAGTRTRVVWLAAALGSLVALSIVASTWTRHQQTIDLARRLGRHVNTFPVDKRGAAEFALTLAQYSELSTELNRLYPGAETFMKVLTAATESEPVALGEVGGGVHAATRPSTGRLDELLEGQSQLSRAEPSDVVSDMTRLLLCRLALDRSSQGSDGSLVCKAIEFFSWVHIERSGDIESFDLDLEEAAQNIGARIDLYCAMRYESAVQWGKDRWGPAFILAESAEKSFERARAAFDRVASRREASPFTRARAKNNLAMVAIRRLEWAATSRAAGIDLSAAAREFLANGERELTGVREVLQESLVSSRMPENALTIAQIDSMLGHSDWQRLAASNSVPIDDAAIQALEHRLDDCVYFIRVAKDLGIGSRAFRGRTHSLGFCWLVYGAAHNRSPSSVDGRVSAVVSAARTQFLAVVGIAKPEEFCDVCAGK